MSESRIKEQRRSRSRRLSNKIMSELKNTEQNKSRNSNRTIMKKVEIVKFKNNEHKNFWIKTNEYQIFVIFFILYYKK